MMISVWLSGEVNRSLKMPSKYVVDTHAMVWFNVGDSRLGPNAKRILSNPDSELIFPITALAEMCWIFEHGRTSIPSITDFLNDRR